MENEKGKLKRFQVTQSIRFGGLSMRLFYYAGLCLGAVSITAVALSVILNTKSFLGLAVIGVLLSAIWVFAVRLISENSFGYANISFYEGGIIFRQSNAPDAKSFTLRWSDCVECGIEKTRRSYWVYASDHKLNDAERKEFPENVEKGVFYFNYADNTWEEFISYLPDKFNAYMTAEKAAKKIK